MTTKTRPHLALAVALFSGCTPAPMTDAAPSDAQTDAQTDATAFEASAESSVPPLADLDATADG